MPTILFLNGFRFFFYSNESSEPAHIHVTKANGEGKIWLLPTIEIAYMYGFNKREINEIMEIATTHSDNFKLKWNEYFNK